MQINSGWRSVLALPWAYRLGMRLLGGDAARRWLVSDIIAAEAGQKIVDIGCGPATILADLPAVEYVGLDISEAYIAAARERYGTRGTFLAGSLADWARDPRPRNADIVLSLGLLHHVSDAEATAILRFAHDILKPGGRLVFYEPSYLIRHGRLSRFVMAQDRGQNIRSEDAWKDLAGSVFPRFKTNIATGVVALPYVMVLGQCYK